MQKIENVLSFFINATFVLLCFLSIGLLANTPKTSFDETVLTGGETISVIVIGSGLPVAPCSVETLSNNTPSLEKTGIQNRVETCKKTNAEEISP
jgi:hypothetical protein